MIFFVGNKLISSHTKAGVQSETGCLPPPPPLSPFPTDFEGPVTDHGDYK